MTHNYDADRARRIKAKLKMRKKLKKQIAQYTLQAIADQELTSRETVNRIDKGLAWKRLEDKS